MAAAVAGAAFAQAPAPARHPRRRSRPLRAGRRASPTPAQTPAATPADAPGAPMIASAALPRDLSPWGMFLNADIVVKIVMVGLVFASLVTWTVWLAKNLELWKATRNGRAALDGAQRGALARRGERAARPQQRDGGAACCAPRSTRCRSRRIPIPRA